MSGIRNAFSGFNQKVLRNNARLIPILLGVVCVAIVAVLLLKNSFGSDDKDQGDTSVGTSGAATAGTPAADYATDREVIAQIVEKYYTAYADGDIAEIEKYKAFTTDTDRIIAEVKSEYIERFDIVSCEIRPGLDPDTYLAFVYRDVKFNDVDELAPGFTTILFTKDDSGDWRLYDGNMDERTADYISTLISDSSDLKTTFNNVQEKYEQILAESPELNEFLTGFTASVNEKVSDRLLEIDQGLDATSDADVSESTGNEGQAQAGSDETGYVKAKETVNVRSSDSTESDSLGKASAGSVYECLEKQANGWTKILYEGRTAFIKSDYLEDVSVDQPVTGSVTYVTAKESVRIRKGPSTSADILGQAATGDKFELIERTSDGWVKVKFNGADAYINADYVK